MPPPRQCGPPRIAHVPRSSPLAFLFAVAWPARSAPSPRVSRRPPAPPPFMASRTPGGKNLPYFSGLRPRSPPEPSARTPVDRAPSATPCTTTTANGIARNAPSSANGARRTAPAASARADAGGDSVETGEQRRGGKVGHVAQAMDVSVLGMRLSIPGRALLLSVPFLWSSYSICLKWLYRLPWALSPAVFNFLRLLVASVVVLPGLLRALRHTRAQYGRGTTRALVVASCELGAYTILVNILQAYGLQYTSASRGAFLGQLSTIIVPLAAFGTGMEARLGWRTCVASVMAVCGVALLTLDSVSAAVSWRGDGVMLGTAFVAAAYILRTKVHADKVAKGPVAAIKICSQTVFAAVYFAVTSGVLTGGGGMGAVGGMFAGATVGMVAVNVGIVIWAGVFVSILSSMLQIRGQQMVSASEAVVIFTSTPLWAAALAIPLGERFGVRGIAGAALILLSTLLSSQSDSEEKKLA